MSNNRRIVCCSPFFREGWRWLEHRLADLDLSWEFHDDRPRNALERHIRWPNLRMVRACRDAVQSARRGPATLLVSHDPRVSFWCAYWADRLGVTAPHVAFSFNYPRLPRGLKFRFMKGAFQRIDRFVTYSTMERDLYARYFGIPADRIDVVLWGVDEPYVADAGMPLIPGDYACAIGGNGRDYATLMAAMERIPDVPLVLVARPHNLKGLVLPANVRVHVNLPPPQTMNVLKFSRFMVLPLQGTEVPCGHVTLVAAMHLGKAFIITHSEGVRDYVQDGVNAIACPAFSPEALAGAIRALWNDADRARQLGSAGKRFASERCSEQRAADYLGALLTQYDIVHIPRVQG